MVWRLLPLSCFPIFLLFPWPLEIYLLPPAFCQSWLHHDHWWHHYQRVSAPSTSTRPPTRPLLPLTLWISQFSMTKTYMALSCPGSLPRAPITCSTSPLGEAVPQLSTWPLRCLKNLFSSPIAFFYTLSLGDLIKFYGFQYSLYANVTQLYCSTPELSPAIQFYLWQFVQHLCPLPSKTHGENRIPCPKASSPCILTIPVDIISLHPAKQAGSLCFIWQIMPRIQSIVKSCSFCFYSTAKILLNPSSAKYLVHALIMSCLDYCNLPLLHAGPLISIENPAVKIIYLTNQSMWHFPSRYSNGSQCTLISNTISLSWSSLHSFSNFSLLLLPAPLCSSLS